MQTNVQRQFPDPLHTHCPTLHPMGGMGAMPQFMDTWRGSLSSIAGAETSVPTSPTSATTIPKIRMAGGCSFARETASPVLFRTDLCKR